MQGIRRFNPRRDELMNAEDVALPSKEEMIWLCGDEDLGTAGSCCT